MADPAPEWLIEHGIGEHRAMLVDGDRVLAARIFWPGELNPGAQVQAILASKRAGAQRGVARTQRGTEILIDHLPKTVTEGASITVAITRAPIAERGRLKQALGRFVDPQTITADSERGIAPDEEPGFRYPMLGVEKARHLPRGQTLDERWDEVWHAASAGQIDFAGGSILVSPTPAMTLIDIDGQGAPRELALAAIPAIAQAVGWFDIAGNIGVDFPTIAAKADRRAVDDALGTALGTALGETLGHWPHERTAMNGFGFVQLVARLEGPSLLHRFATSRVGLCARMALRAGERAQGIGPVLLITVHPALNAKLKPAWIEELARRTGKEVRIKTDPGVALEAPHAQIIQP